MKRLSAFLILLWCLSWSTLAVYGVANNPASQTALQIQGPDPTGNQGYPVAVVGASGGDPVNVAVVSGGGGPTSVTQGTSPWVVGQDAGSNPWTVNGTVGATQSGTWTVQSNKIGTPADAFTGPTSIPQVQGFPQVYNGSDWDMTRSANAVSGTTGTGLVGSGQMGWDGTNWYRCLVESAALPNQRCAIYSQGNQALCGAPADNTNNAGLTTLSMNSVWDGTDWDRARSSNAASGTTGTGLLGAGSLGFDGTNWYKTLDGNGLTNVGNNASANGIPGSVLYGFDSNGPLFRQVQSERASGDGMSASINALVTCARAYACNGAGWDRVRVANKSNTVATAAAGNTALWTPAAGKKFRLMKYMIEVTEQATQAVGGTINISLFDGAAGATGQVHDVYIPGAALGAAGELYTSPWIDLGNGYLSAAANNVLNVNLSAALTGGTVRVICSGTEE